MFMTQFDQSQYPKFAAYLRDSFPTLLEVPNIVDGMRVWGYMTMDEIRTVLSWESGSVFRGHMVAIRPVVDWEPGARNGKFDNEIKRTNQTFGEVVVSPQEARAFEDGKGVKITGYGRKVYSVGAQILGQLVFDFARNHLWRPDFHSEALQAAAQRRRRGFFNQVYGGTPR